MSRSARPRPTWTSLLAGTDVISSRSRELLWMGGIRVPRNALTIMQLRLGAPFPTRAGSRSSARHGLPCGPPARSAQRAWRWPGWQNYRPTGLALAPVPGLGARLSEDEPVAAGCLRDWLWSLVRLRGDDHKGRQFEINTGPESPCSTKAGHRLQICSSCPVPADLDRIRGGIGTTASPWAPDSDGLVENGRAPKPGTAARATRGSVLIPTRPAPHVRERRERVDTRDRSPCA